MPAEQMLAAEVQRVRKSMEEHHDEDNGASRSGDIERLCHEFEQAMESVSSSVTLLVAKGGKEGGSEGYAKNRIGKEST